MRSIALAITASSAKLGLSSEATNVSKTLLLTVALLAQSAHILTRLSARSCGVHWQ
jgi:hypothetical protein